MEENLNPAFEAIDELAAEQKQRQEQTGAQMQAYTKQLESAQQEAESNSNPAFAVIDEMQAERRRSAGALVDGDAMKAAKVRDLSERYGTTRTAAEINYDTLFAQANRDDADEALTQAPSLAKYFAENQKDAPIFKDDLGVLSRIEEGFRKIGSRYSSNSNEPVDAQPNAKYWDTEETTGDAALDERIRPMMNSSQIGRGAQAGWLIGQQGQMWADAGNNQALLNNEFKKRDEEIDEELEQLAGDDSDAAFYNAAQIVGTMLSTMLGGSEGAVAGGALVTGAMAVGAAPASVPILLGGMALGMGTEGTRKVEGGLSLKTLIDQGVPYEKAVQIAGSVGAVNALIEMGGVSVLGKAFSPIAKSLNSLFTSKSVKALESPTLRGAFMDVARLYTMGVGQEVITEAAQEVTSMVGEEVGRLWGETGAKGISMDEAIDRILDVGEMTLKGSAVLGALSTGPVMVNHAAKINRANQTKEFFENLTQDVAQMKGANLSPGATKEVIDGVAQDAGAGTIYVDGYAFRQVMVEAGVRPEDLEQVVPGLSQQVDAAAVNGTDVTMSTGDFAARLAASPFGQKLVPHMRLNENDLSQVEADNLEKSVKQMRRAAVRYAINPDEQIVDPDELKVENDATLTPEQKKEQRKAIRTAREQRRQADKDARDAYVTGITNSLTQAGFSSREARTQARFAGAVMSNLAKRLEIPVQEAVDRYGVNVSVSDDSPSGNRFNMPVTQGIEWPMGPSKTIKPDDTLTVIRVTNVPVSRKEAVAQAADVFSRGVTNKSTGFVLTASRSDMKKAAGGIGSLKERVFTAVAMDIARIAEESILVESHVDVQHRNPKVQGVHHFIAPVEFGGKLWRVQLLVRDIVEPKNDRAIVHSVDGIDIQEMETPPGGISQSESGASYVNGVAAADNRLVRLDTDSGPTDRTLSLTDLIGGRVPYERADGRGLFDAVEESSFAENGVYYEAPVFNQTAWHGSPHQFDRFSTEHIGSGEGAQMHGWGLYFADDQAVADRYRGSLVIGRGGNEYSIAYKGARPEELPQSLRVGLERLKGNVLHIDSDIRREYESLVYSLNERFEAADRIAKVYEGLIAQIDENPKQSISSFLARVPEDEKYRADLAVKSARAAAKNEGRRASVHDVRTQLNDSLAAVDQQRRENKEPLDALRQIDPDDLTVEYDSGRVFKVDIPDPDKMLDEQKLWGAGSNFELKAKIRGMISEWNGDHLDTEQMIYVPDRPTGRDVYQAISKAMGGPKQASLWLKDRGIEGITYVGGTDGRCYVVFDDQAIEVLDFYQRQGGESLGSYSPTENRITLTPNADLSTFSHEMGHWYLNTLFAVARAGDATPSILEDVNAVLKEFGIANIAEWDALGFEGQRKYHERFASWTEQYLAEAKAPVGLKKFFRTLGKFIRDAYRTFMAGVVEGTQTRYRQETGEELPMFSEEVRRVLDRMVAGEAAVEQNEQAQSLTPLFETKPDDMSDEEWREYAAEHDDAVQSGAELLVKAQAKDERWYSNARSKILKEMQARAEEIRKNTRERVEARLMKSREFTALNILQSSDRPGIAFDARIDPKSLDGLLEAGQIEILRKAGMLKDGGVDVKVSRELLRPFANFRSDRTFLNGLLRVADKERVIEEQTTAECLKKYGELFDPVKRDKTVSKALHNEARGRMVATELKYLINDKEARSRVYLAAARQAAMALVDRTRIGKAKVATFLSAEGRAARRALEAFRKGDLEAAANFKRQQIVNHEAARLVSEAEDKRERLKELRNLVFKSDKKLAARYDTNIMAVARAVLTNRNMGKATENVDDAVEEILKKVKQYDPEIFEGLKSFMDRHPYSPGRDPSMLTVAEFIGVVDDVQALVKLARDARQITLDGKKQDLDQAIEALKKAILSADNTRFRPGQERASTKKEENRKLYFTARAFVMRVENWCRAMDNGQDLGPFTRYIFRPVADAAAKYRVKNAEIQERFAALIKPMEEKWEEVGEIEAPELGYTFERKSELIGALMHIGNESNKSKMLIGGRGEDASWADRVVLANGEVIYSYARWDRFFARAMREGIITKDDMDFVQAVWDLLEETKGMSQKAFKEYYGCYFDEVQASPVVTPWGIYRGGYVPAATDPMLVAGRDKQIEQDLFESQSEYQDMMPVTQPGWSKAREKKYYKPLVLNVGMLGAHIQSVVKFAMMAPAVKNVQRIVKDRRFADLMNDIDPKVISDMLTPWLRRSATQTISTPTNAFGRILNQVRGLAGMSLMAGNVANVLQQYTGFSIAMSEVGARNTAQGLKEYLRDTKSAYARVTEASTFMKGRLEDFCFEYQNEVNRIASSRAPTKVEEVRDWTQRKAYILQTLAQRTIDIPVWLAAYNQAITEKGMADADAVFYADSVVRRTQSSFDPESVSRVETGDPLQRSILVFYNYFNMQLNLLRESYTRAKTTGKYGRFTLDFAMIVAIPAILSEVIAQAFSGFDTGDDDDWDAVDGLQLAITSVNKNMVAMLPFFGNVINMTGTKMSRGDYGAVSDVSKMLFGNNPYNDKLVSVPVMSLFENSAEGAKNLLLLLFSEEYDPDPRRAARNTLDLLTLMTGIPFSGVKKPVGYLAGVAGDEYSVDNPVDFTRGFISGKDPNAE